MSGDSGKELVVDSVIDNALISLSSKSTVGGLFTSLYGWLTQTGSAVFIGIVITILGFLVNYYFQRKKAKRDHILWQQMFDANERAEKRKEELHLARLEAIRLGYKEENTCE